MKIPALILLGVLGFVAAGVLYTQTQTASRGGSAVVNEPAAPTTQSAATSSGTQAKPPGQKKPLTEAPKMEARALEAGISVGDNFTGLTDEQLGKRLDSMVALGVTWLRFDADWSYTQRRDGSYSWKTLDRIVSMARARHLQLLPILDFTPSWARIPNCDGNRCEPRNADEFAAFAAAAVTRYAPQGVKVWEIWNEPNIKQFWQPAPDAAAYTALLKTAYVAIKKNDPQAMVVLGGLASVDSGGGNIHPLDFLEQIYAHGGGPYFDAVAFHPYTYPLLPSNTARWNAWQEMANMPRSIRSIMANNGDADKKIWVTEFGAPTGGPGSVSESLQAAILADAFALAKAYSWMGPLFVYTFVDKGTNPDTSENFYGLVRYDGGEKPAYQALKSALSAQ